jgi:hypothetical protein
VASWPSAPSAVFALDDRRWWTIGEDDRLRLWDRAEQGLVATVTALTDGAWVVERGDGVTVSSPSLRDGSAVATQLFKPGDL